MPLDTAGTWTITSNGDTAHLILSGIEASGIIASGSTFNDSPITGFWDESSQKLMFMRITVPSNVDSFQVYTGYKMSGTDITSPTIAGSFEAFRDNGGVAQRNVFGWFGTFVPNIS